MILPNFSIKKLSNIFVFNVYKQIYIVCLHLFTNIYNYTPYYIKGFLYGVEIQVMPLVVCLGASVVWSCMPCPWWCGWWPGVVDGASVVWMVHRWCGWSPGAYCSRAPPVRGLTKLLRAAGGLVRSRAMWIDVIALIVNYLDAPLGSALQSCESVKALIIRYL